jgi:NAD(P)-dependent dehydrogenase (short-subunit alcohol dehydrogenase family)
MQLKGKVALVTGGARRLGREIALALAGAGCDVAIHYGRSGAAADETSGLIARSGVRSTALQADLSQPDQIEGLFQVLERDFGRLDILVNSAASFVSSPVESITSEAWDAVMAVNLRAPFICSQHGAQLMKRASRPPGEPAHIVNIGDLSGLQVWARFAHHGVSKAGLMHLTRSMAREMAPDVRVNAIVPGAILPPPGMDEESEAWLQVGERIPLGRVGKASDVANSVLFLCRSDFITGEELVVDGGERLVATSHR